MASAVQAKWIWKSGPLQVNDYALFRHSFEGMAGVRDAVLRVSAHHYLHLYVNGRRLSGYGTPAPTAPPLTKPYLTYNVTSMLVPGSNTVAAVVHYLGGGGQNSVDGYPGFWCEMEITGAEGQSRLLVSDEAWEVCEESPYAAGRPYQQSRRISASEFFDARTAARTKAWLRGEEGESPSGRAVLSAIESAEPPWILRPQEMPEGAEERTFRPEPCGIQQPGHQVFDAGQITSGWVRITLKGMPGATLRIRYAEQLDKDGSVSHYVCNEPSETYYDEYEMAGGQETAEIWQPDFAYKAFRYFEITGYPGWIRPEDLEVVWAHTPLGDEGRFECSDPLLNAMFEACIRTQKNNVLGLVVDCPHREQAQYLADSDLQAETLLAFFGDARPVLRKVLADFRDTMSPEGTFPFVAPGSTGRPEFDIRIPEWDLHFVTLLWKVYFAFEDAETVREFYGTARRLIDALLGQIPAETGLLPKNGDWHISDWPYPGVDQEGPYLTVQNAKFYRALILLARLAPVAGVPEEASRFESAADVLKGAMLRHLYDAPHKRWRDCWGSDSCSQGMNALAAYIGLTPAADLPEAVAALTGEWSARTVLSLELFRLLFEQGHKETAFEWLSRPEYPGWGYMIAQGARTMWEGFEDIESHSHAWNGYPARLMADYLLGVRASEPGHSRITIEPYFSPKLTYAKGTIKTARGEVAVRWERREGAIRLFAELPAGTAADVVLPGTKSGPLRWEEGFHYITLTEGETLTP